MVSMEESEQSLEKKVNGGGMSDETRSYRRTYYLEPGVEPSEFLKNHSVETTHGQLIIDGKVLGFYKRDCPPELLTEKNRAAIFVETVPPSERLNMDLILRANGYRPPFHYWEG